MPNGSAANCLCLPPDGQLSKASRALFLLAAGKYGAENRRLPVVPPKVPHSEKPGRLKPNKAAKQPPGTISASGRSLSRRMPPPIPLPDPAPIRCSHCYSACTVQPGRATRDGCTRNTGSTSCESSTLSARLPIEKEHACDCRPLSSRCHNRGSRPFPCS